MEMDALHAKRAKEGIMEQEVETGNAPWEWIGCLAEGLEGILEDEREWGANAVAAPAQKKMGCLTQAR